ncbi:MAG: HAMP domain-containing histidine kinase [Gammaproteobacteria bacterium]|nr:HAMP domain-containing histidine kinase [Gammaproteobacteria bacterium]
MRTGRPFRQNSLYKLSLTSLVIITLPLVIAFIYALVAITQYTTLTQQTLINTIIVTDSNRIILERLVSMERNIRQYQILKEPELLKGFQDHHQTFIDTARNMKLEGVKSQLQTTMNTLLKNENKLYLLIVKKITSDQQELTKDDLNNYADLTLEARKLVNKGGIQLRQEAKALSSEANQVQQNLIYSIFFAIPLALTLALIFSSLLTKPIKHIGYAIREIGKGDFNQPIEIHGPKDLEELGKHLEWLRNRLNQLEDDKQNFIKNISHELKTPLATLKEGSSILQDEIVGELNQEQQEILQLMRLGCIQLNSLIENLLEYQKAISIQTELNCSTFDLDLLIKRIIEEYRLIINIKKIKTKEFLIPFKIHADRDKVRVIISNLLSNALKFGVANSELGISIRKLGINIYVLVEDQGKGISVEDKKFIFNEFYQEKSSESWPVRGSGLGLKLIKDYIKIHHGDIKLLKPNKRYSGARFLIRLPINQHTQQGIME